jgi:hypothetical protein
VIPERLSPDRFAAALAARLDSVVPTGLSVRAHGPAVGIYDPNRGEVSVITDVVAEEDGRSVIERVETTARALLDSMQDVVQESTTEQWPMGPAGVAEPEVRVVGDQLQMWFGDEAGPVLRLQPVDLTELAAGAA